MTSPQRRQALVFARADKLVHNDLSNVEEVTELSFPDNHGVRHIEYSIRIRSRVQQSLAVRTVVHLEIALFRR